MRGGEIHDPRAGCQHADIEAVMFSSLWCREATDVSPSQTKSGPLA